MRPLTIVAGLLVLISAIAGILLKSKGVPEWPIQGPFEQQA